MQDDIAFLGARELARRLRGGEFSSLELLEFYLSRIDRLNGELNAVVTLDGDRARKKAELADARLERGETGALLGLPITIKDAYEVGGVRTTGGAPIFKDHVPPRSATAVARLEEEGAIVFGKTNVPFFSSDVQTFNEIFGTTNNPWNTDRTSGGSSGGAAVSVACGFTAFEIGSDIGGSIRTPANWNGIYGHKATWGIIPGRGHIPGPPGTASEADLGVFGPLARTADDLDFILDILAGPNEYASVGWSLSLPPPRHTALRSFRVAAFFDDEATPVDARVRHRLDATVAALREVGVAVDDKVRPVPSLADVQDHYFTMLAPVVSAGLAVDVIESLRAAAMAGDPNQAVTRFARGAVQSHGEWLSCNERRVRLQHEMKDFFENYDVLLCPGVSVPAIPHDHAADLYGRLIEVNGEERGYVDLMGWIALATLAGLPATNAPIGATEDGLPVGLQIIGPALEDRTTIAFARELAGVIGGYSPPPVAR